ncbi:MAG TPA: MFS transporter, partial [Dehalococcoidia bacterium]|nr:MFS transporter [Dehalococcoidia bacterium]
YLVLGAIIALVIFPLAWRLVRPDPVQMGLLPDGDTQAQAAASGAAGRGLAANKSLADAMRTRAYWLICLGWFTCGYVGFMVATHLVPFATDVGMEPMAAAGVLALMGVFSAAGSFGAGAISDRVGRKNPLAIVYFSRFLAVPLLMTPLVFTNHVLIYAFAVVFGLGQLATLPLASTMTREIFGQQSMGVILGTILLAHQIGAAIGVYLGGALFDATGSYYWAFLSGALLSLIAAVGSYMIREERRPAYAPNMIPAE